ncbi:hypothetical protein GCM10017559_64430 [Streptosporangium longisporum]|uniref:Uncharacterized protein n=1 Tax=Streptosporangium longisporum TaxID=46187 RepID=A0ABP6L0N5_9ACTN
MASLSTLRLGRSSDTTQWTASRLLVDMEPYKFERPQGGSPVCRQRRAAAFGTLIVALPAGPKAGGDPRVRGSRGAAGGGGGGGGIGGGGVVPAIWRRRASIWRAAERTRLASLE